MSAIDTTVMQNKLRAIEKRFAKPEMRWQRDQLLGEVYAEQAQLLDKQGDKQAACALYLRSFEHYPYIAERNSEGGMCLFEQEDYDGAARLWYIAILMRRSMPIDYVLITNKIQAGGDRSMRHPLLFSLYAWMVRVHFYDFGYPHANDAVRNSLPQAEALLAEFPENQPLLFELAIIYKEVLEQPDIALSFYQRYFNQRKKSGVLERFYDLVDLSLFFDKDLTQLHYPGSNIGVHGAYDGTSLMERLEDDRLCAQKSAQILRLSNEVFSNAYQLFNDYFTSGLGASRNNKPHLFAMCCNNYGLILSKLKDDAKAMAIHYQGYQVSPFYENIYNAAKSAYWANRYDLAVDYYAHLFKDYTIHTLSTDIAFFATSHYAIALSEVYWHGPKEKQVDPQLILSTIEQANHFYGKIKHPDQYQIADKQYLDDLPAYFQQSVDTAVLVEQQIRQKLAEVKQLPVSRFRSMFPDLPINAHSIDLICEKKLLYGEDIIEIHYQGWQVRINRAFYDKTEKCFHEASIQMQLGDFVYRIYTTTHSPSWLKKLRGAKIEKKCWQRYTFSPDETSQWRWLSPYAPQELLQLCQSLWHHLLQNI